MNWASNCDELKSGRPAIWIDETFCPSYEFRLCAVPGLVLGVALALEFGCCAISPKHPAQRRKQKRHVRTIRCAVRVQMGPRRIIWSRSASGLSDVQVSGISTPDEMLANWGRLTAALKYKGLHPQ